MSYRISPNSRYKQQSSLAATANQFDSTSQPNSNSNSPNQTRPTRASPKSVQCRTEQVKEEQPIERINQNEEQFTQDRTNNPDDALPHKSTVQQSNGDQLDHQPAHQTANHHDANQPSTPIDQRTSQDAKPNGSKDSPAFRLRTRRSTPRKLDSIYSSPYSTSRKTSLYSPTNSEQLQAKVAKLKSAPSATVHDVKRNLFDASRPANGNPNSGPAAKVSRLHSPSRSFVEDMDLAPFAENIRVEKLTETGKNGLNYLCLRIIEVLNEEWLTECSADCSNRSDQDRGRIISCSSVSPSIKCSTNSSTNNSMDDRSNENHKLNDSNDRHSHDHPNPSSPDHHLSPTGSPLLNCSSCPKQRLLKIYCQQAETKSILNAQKPVVLLQLHNEYCDFKDRLLAGKILEIVKFEVKKLPQPANYRHSAGEVPVYPFYIEVRANKDPHWVTLLSVKKKYEPTNSNLLNVINTQNRHQFHIEDQPPTKNPRIVFSSYVVNEPAANEQANQPLKNTNSPTIRRFMKKINKSVK